MRSKPKRSWASPSPTDEPVLEPNRLGSSPIGGGSDTLGYTLMGMAAAGSSADALTDAHIHYMSLNQYPDGAFRNSSYRPPTEYSPLRRRRWRCGRSSSIRFPAAARSSRSAWSGPNGGCSRQRLPPRKNDRCSSMRSRIPARLHPNALRS